VSEISSPTALAAQGIGKRVRNIATGALFALVLLIPRLLRIRRSPAGWLTVRILLAATGAALVILPLSLGNNLLPSIVGLIIFLVAILLPSARSHASVPEKAAELGALVVVNGGEYYPVDGAPVAAQLFIGAEMIWALDSQLKAILAFSTVEISAVQALQASNEGNWIFRIRGLNRTADFCYSGVFAEHFARVAESTIRGVLRPALPVLPQKRAAGA
jgi:hypothetical protein